MTYIEGMTRNVCELQREVQIAQKALEDICKLAWKSEQETMGKTQPELNRILIRARGALAEMEDTD